MTESIISLLVAALAGATMALQGTMNSALGKSIGLWQATFFVHLTGLAVSAVLMFTMGNAGRLGGIVSSQPLSWLGGALGVVIIYGVAVSMGKVGVSPATTAIVAAQLLTAFVIDQCGFMGAKHLPFHWMRLGGAALIVFGAWLILRRC